MKDSLDYKEEIDSATTVVQCNSIREDLANDCSIDINIKHDLFKRIKFHKDGILLNDAAKLWGFTLK